MDFRRVPPPVRPVPPMGLYPGRLPQMMRMTPTSAALVAIQSAAHATDPPPAAVQPINRTVTVSSTTPYFIGGSISGQIDYQSECEGSVEVRDEVTSRHSAVSFSKFLARKRRDRTAEWKSYWNGRKPLNAYILKREKQIAVKALAQASEDGEAENHRFQRQIESLPFSKHNVGAFDLPRPRAVVIPDPREVTQMTMHHTVDVQRKLARSRATAARKRM